VQHIKEKSVTWRDFKKYFEKKYLTKRYYDKKMKDFFELKLGSMTIDEYERRFLELLKYISFIKDETVKNQRYLSGLPSFISDKIQYDDPKTLGDTIRQAKCLYDQQKARPTFQKDWEDKNKFNMFRNNPQIVLTKEPPIQCWGCKGDHMFKDCEKGRIVHNVQQAEMVEDMGRNVPRIYAALDNK
jgi:hypothetical protein